MHCGMFSSISGLHCLNAKETHPLGGNQIISRHWYLRSGGGEKTVPSWDPLAQIMQTILGIA